MNLLSHTGGHQGLAANNLRRRRASSAASANSQSRNVATFGLVDVALGQTIQYVRVNFKTHIEMGRTSSAADEIPRRKCRARLAATPCPSTAASTQHALRAVQGKAVRRVDVDDPGRIEPLRPSLAVVQVQQWRLEQVRRFGQAVAAHHQFRTANRK